MLVAMCLALLFPTPVAHGYKKADCKDIEQILGTRVELEQGVCKASIPRNFPVTYKGIKLSPETMELEFVANFEPVNGKTVVTGEFSLLQDEITPVLDTLRKGNLEITAIHNHWLHENPRLIYLHFQGIGTAKNLARTVKAAIRVTHD